MTFNIFRIAGGFLRCDVCGAALANLSREDSEQCIDIGIQDADQDTIADFSHLASILILLHKMTQMSVSYISCARPVCQSLANEPVSLELLWHLVQVARTLSPGLHH